MHMGEGGRQWRARGCLVPPTRLAGNGLRLHPHRKGASPCFWSAFSPPPSPQTMSNSKQPHPPVRTAAGLQECGRLRKGETVLITAAAGGAGQFAVQLAKLAGCHVIATVGSEDKARLIRSLGADRAVNYRTEDLKAVLRAEYPRGVDVVWESVGGEWFGTCLNALAQKGRLIVIGAMSQYKGPDGWKPMPHRGLPEKVLNKSTTVTGGHVGWGGKGEEDPDAKGQVPRGVLCRATSHRQGCAEA